jgi:hypothetical protein
LSETFSPCSSFNVKPGALSPTASRATVLLSIDEVISPVD